MGMVTPTWMPWLLVAVGALGRHCLGTQLLRQLGGGFPWGTLAANLGGSFLVGFLAVWLEGRGPSALHWRAFLIVGVLGALTTYSALMLECLLYSRSQRMPLMLGYLGTTLVGGMLLVWAGALLAGALRAGA